MIKNRIIGSGIEKLDQILFNPRNWRIHPLNQQNSLKTVLDEVGWVQEVIVNRRTGHLVDGHLRCQLAARNGETEIPVKYIDVSEDEERLIISTLDPIGSLAIADKDKLKTLLDEIKENDENLKDLAEIIGKTQNVIPIVNFDEEWVGMPEFENEDLSPYRTIKVHFANENDVQEFARTIGQKITEKTKYVWFPKQVRESLVNYVCVSEDGSES